MARSRSSSSARRRQLVWARDKENIAILTGSTNIVDMLAPYRADGGDTQGATVTRIIMRIRIGFTSVTAIPNADMPLMGIIKERKSLTVAAAPSLLTDQHIDWMYWGALFWRDEVTPAGALSHTLSMVYDLDLSGKRKLGEVDDTLWWMLLGSTAGAAACAYTSSVLLMLP